MVYAPQREALDVVWLKRQLKSCRGNQSGLAKAIGKDRSAITRLVEGARQLKLEEVGIFATYLGVSQADVLAWANGQKGERRILGFEEMKQANIKHLAKSSQEPADKNAQHPAYGALKGLITIPPGVDLTEPSYPDWRKLYGEDR